MTRLIDAAAAAIRPGSADTLPGVIAGVTDDTGTLFLAAAGPHSADADEPLAADAVVALYSVTKSLTASVAAILATSGDLDLDAPASAYEPRLAQIGVLDGFDSDGSPRVRAPKSAVTTRQLLTHTAGFGYHFFDDDLTRAVAAYDLPDIGSATFDALRTPLLFDPGTQWRYGANIDWAGLVIEAVTGTPLSTTMSQYLLEPLGMSDTVFRRNDRLLARAAPVHIRTPDGGLRALRVPGRPDSPEIEMGGQGLYSTVGDMLKFLRMWLADGRADDGTQVVSPAAIHIATTEQLSPLSVMPLAGVDPRLTNDLEFFPGISKGWNLIAMTNATSAPTGRSAGSMGWAGLANLYFWIDRHRRIAGLWATQLFPFADQVAMRTAMDFEQAVYRALD